MIRGAALLGGLAGVVAASLAAGLWFVTGTGTANGVQPDDADPRAGADLYAANCAACHGAALEGQGDWRSPGDDGRLPPPPHDETGHTWHHSDAVLFDYAKLGGQAALAKSGIEGFDSGMPAFADILTDAQIWDILAYIKSTWPDKIRAVQADRSATE